MNKVVEETNKNINKILQKMGARTTIRTYKSATPYSLVM
jgi:hypothetical protein